jgi:hypothetical protein
MTNRLAAFALALFALPLSAAEPPRDPLVKRVEAAINKGVQFLRDAQQPATNGVGANWETGLVGEGAAVANLRPGGMTSLAILALLNAGVPVEDPTVQRGLEWLRTFKPRHTYVYGLQTMAFAEAGLAKDKPLIQRNIDWMLKYRVPRNGPLLGWTYDDALHSPDNSNTQYALLGLWAGKTAGATIDKDTWQAIQDFYTRTQLATGAWTYHPDQPGDGPRLTMTVAGLCGLLIAGMELSQGKQQLDPVTGIAAKCGQYDQNEPVARALAWIAGTNQFGKPRFGFENDLHTFYNVYGIERAGRLTGQRFLAGRDWYRDGCEFLLDGTPTSKWMAQRDNGSWSRAKGADGWAVVSTSFSLIFLSKGRTPLLVTKFAHSTGESWNRKHYDARNIVDYASKELFKRQPLAWQMYDVRQKELSAEQRKQEVADLLQAPILYLNGHQAPKLNRSQKLIIRQYIEEGGFVLAEACCGDPRFADGIRELFKDPDLFPDADFLPLKANHPIWSAHALVPPDAFDRLGRGRLEGLEMGCKTVAILSPHPLAGWWEENRRDVGAARDAFRLGGNIIAYATGMELPKPRLTKVEIVDANDERRANRGFLKVAQLKHEGDWQPAPRAMRNLLAKMRQDLGLDVDLRTEALPVNHPDLPQFRFLYVHGRREFTFDERDLDRLRFNLETGGTLFADACCGRTEFDTAFRAFVKKLFPQGKLETIPLSDDLFGADLNGKPIKQVRCRREKPGTTVPEEKFADVAPYLEGIKVDGRWVLIYSKYDVGCALEKHQSSDCKGYDPESALHIGQAVVLYALKR